jgi:hypothetical protein
MRSNRAIALTVLLILCAAATGIAQQKHESCPLHKEHQSGKAEAKPEAHDHDKHLSEVNRRGDRAMGFSHEKTTHRFRLTAEGGMIEVRANDAADAESLDLIRRHLAAIADSFKAGDFEKPLETHGKIPPGVPIMTSMKAEIDYRYEELDRGGRVLISTKNQNALRAIHEFLRFQIEDHQTGDSVEVEKN